ncbi:hypothetical protein D3C73_1092140 [compost metagenome]
MYEDLAWKSFETTGNIESFLEYKEMIKAKSNINEGLDVIEGVSFNEFGESQGNSDKRGNV